MDNEKIYNGTLEQQLAGKLPEGAPLIMESVPPALRHGPRGPVQLTKEEKLEADNIALRAENLAYRKQSLMATINDLTDLERQLGGEAKAFKEKMGEKYGMDPKLLKIRHDGTLLEVQDAAQGQQP